MYPGAIEADTIVAIATPPGRGGIGIVRISGPRALLLATPLLRLATPLEPARARFCELIDPGTSLKLDEAVVTWFRGPRSYTGEDVVEIAAHGAPVVLEMIVRQTLQAGARLADPGEFTARAFFSGRMDLTQAEAVRDLIEAQTLYQARVAAEQMGGALSRRIAPAKSELIALIAALEAGIDFAEDDTPVLSAGEIVTAIDTIAVALTQLERSFTHGRLVHSGLTLAIVGKPNVGKSSLFNRLVERERAIVTATPGTTRDPVSERVSLNGIPLQLIDTAGLRDSTDEAELIGIAKSREALAEADLVLAVIDASDPVSADHHFLDSLAGRPVLVVANKSDLVNESAVLPACAVSTSARTGEGIELLRQKIAQALQFPGTGTDSGMLTNLRQHQAILTALSTLAAARNSAMSDTPHEMLLLELYAALAEIDALTGATTSDDILKLIFSTFCIGK